MNEQIKQIALQARLGPVLLLELWGNIDALTDSEQQQLKEIEQFAELIIQECAQVAQKYMSRFAEDHELTKQIKLHFGVE